MFNFVLICGIFPLNSVFGGYMGYKQMDNNFSFTDLFPLNSMEHNLSIKGMLIK
jgi:hypothetical protein